MKTAEEGMRAGGGGGGGRVGRRCGGERGAGAGEGMADGDAEGGADVGEGPDGRGAGAWVWADNSATGETGIEDRGEERELVVGVAVAFGGDAGRAGGGIWDGDGAGDGGVAGAGD